MCQIIIVRSLIICETVFSLFYMSEFLFFCIFIFQNKGFKKQLKRKPLKSHGTGPRTQRASMPNPGLGATGGLRPEREQQPAGGGDAAEQQASPPHTENVSQAEFSHRRSFCCKE